MIAKIDDSNINQAGVDAMTPAQLKAFENRLRRMAESRSLNVRKYRTFPDDKLVFALVKAGTNSVPAPDMVNLNLIELRDYLYRGEK